MLNKEHKRDKFIGFRIPVEEYVLTIETASRLGISITDFILSLLLPEINKNRVEVINAPASSKQRVNYEEPPYGKILDFASDANNENSSDELEVNSENILNDVEQTIQNFNNLIK